MLHTADKKPEKCTATQLCREHGYFLQRVSMKNTHERTAHTAIAQHYWFSRFILMMRITLSLGLSLDWDL